MKEDVQPLASLFRWIEQHVHEVDGDERTNIIEELKDVENFNREQGFAANEVDVDSFVDRKHLSAAGINSK